jgi:hypothetical protein
MGVTFNPTGLLDPWNDTGIRVSEINKSSFYAFI